MSKWRKSGGVLLYCFFLMGLYVFVFVFPYIYIYFFLSSQLCCINKFFFGFVCFPFKNIKKVKDDDNDCNLWFVVKSRKRERESKKHHYLGVKEIRKRIRRKENGTFLMCWLEWTKKFFFEGFIFVKRQKW